MMVGVAWTMDTRARLLAMFGCGTVGLLKTSETSGAIGPARVVLDGLATAMKGVSGDSPR